MFTEYPNLMWNQIEVWGNPYIFGLFKENNVYHKTAILFTLPKCIKILSKIFAIKDLILKFCKTTVTFLNIYFIQLKPSLWKLSTRKLVVKS